MNTYARVIDGLVDHIHRVDGPLGERFGKEMRKIMHECPANVRPGYAFDGITFTPPPLAEMKAEKRVAIKTEGAALMGLALPYDDFLTAIWPNLPANVQSLLQPIVDAGQAARQAVNNATTNDEVDAVTPNWPE